MGRKRDKQWYKKRKEFLETPGVLDKLTLISAKHGFSVKELVDLIGFESSFRHDIANKHTNATGLIQFMPKTAKSLGTSTKDLKGMGILGQLDYVEKYFDRNHKKGTHPYITVAYPKAGKYDKDRVIAGPNSKMAKQNPGWVDKNGNITRASIESFVSPDGVDVHDPSMVNEKIKDSSPLQQKEEMRIMGMGDMASMDNINKILDEVNFSDSTVDGDFFDQLEVNVGNVLDNSIDVFSDRTDLEKMARKVVNNYGKDDLELTFQGEGETPVEGDTAYDPTQPKTNEAANGGIQPNGRRSSFTREEDIAAQDNTYKSLNIF